MTKKLTTLIKKLSKKYPNYDMDLAASMNPIKEEKMVGGKEVVVTTYTMCIKLMVFDDYITTDHNCAPKVKRIVRGVGEGKTQLEAINNAKIDAIHNLGVF